MISFEQEVQQFMDRAGILYDNQCGSTEHLDFGFGDKASKGYFHFDVKEKRQRYNVHNWRTSIPEAYFFILDDLAARKTLAYAPNSGIVIRDNMHSRYFFFSVVDLFLMPKVRVNRRINRQLPGLKGKWLIDLRNGICCTSLSEIFQHIARYLESRKEIFTSTLACYGSYQGETLEVQGIPRRPGHWEIDINETR